MGISILELVIRRLREEEFTADAAYPGQTFPPITAPVAAVHIEKVDRAGLTVTVEVNILCPASLGGTACELEALRATEVLRQLGAVCIQNGCRYDGTAQVYAVPVLASFTAVTGAEECTIGPGFYVYINELRHPHVTGFSMEEAPLIREEFSMGQTAPEAVIREGSRWTIRMEELIPAGSTEDPEPEDGFQVKVITDAKVEFYDQCSWTSVKREYTREGLRRIRSGTARGRREVLVS